MFGEGTAAVIGGTLLGMGLAAITAILLDRWQHRRRGMVTEGRYRDICPDCNVPTSHLLGGRWEAEHAPTNGPEPYFYKYRLRTPGANHSTFEGAKVTEPPTMAMLEAAYAACSDPWNPAASVSGATCRDCFRSTGKVSQDCGQCDGTGIDPMPPTDIQCADCGHVLLADEDPVFRGEKPYHELCAEGVDKAVALDVPDREVREAR